METKLIDGKTPIEWGSIAIDKADGPTAVAKALTEKYERISGQAVDKWRKTGIPAKWIIPMEKLVVGEVKRHQMSPAIYPPEEYSANAA